MTSKRYTFPSSQKLKRTKLIDDLFQSGKQVRTKDLTLVFKEPNAEIPNCMQAGFSVSKRKFKRAIDRNRLKRLMREAWRYEKLTLEELLVQSQRKLIVMLIFTGTEMPGLDEVKSKISLLLQELQTQLRKNFSVIP